MRGRVLVLALALGLAAAFLTRGAPPVLLPALSTGGAPPAPATGTLPPPASVERIDRDPFRYLDDAELRSAQTEATSPPPEPQQEATPAPLRLVGLIRQGGRLQAALSIHGVALTAAAGDVVEGYEVLSIDEDAGVRLREASGAEIVLVPE